MYPVNQAVPQPALQQMPLLNPGGNVFGQASTQSSASGVLNGGKLKLPDGGRLYEPGVFRQIKIDARRSFRAIYKSELPLGRQVDDIPTIVSTYTISSAVNGSQVVGSNPVASSSSSSMATTTALPPPKIMIPVTPPDWQNYHDELVRIASKFQRFPVDSKSFEYRKIVEMVEPYTVLSIDKIVNRKVWEPYATRRNELLKQKSEDPDVWRALGMTTIEVEARINRDKEFRDKNPTLANRKGKYDLNEALLFHCTRYKKNVEPILTQGLDERLGADTASVLMGKGIYFSDHPKKSCGYIGDSQTIMLFSVILGDCKDMEVGGPEVKALRAEPEKKSEEKRNADDKTFDSITGRPNYPTYNEFVIFDRNQCCPMYEVKLCQKSIESAVVEIAPGHEDFALARGESPDFAWKKQKMLSYYIPKWQNEFLKWPFFISSLYETMDLSSNLKKLKEMGYEDNDLNEYILSELDNDLDEAVEYIKYVIEEELEKMLEGDEEESENEPVIKKRKPGPKSKTTANATPSLKSALSYSSVNMEKPIKCRRCSEWYKSRGCIVLKCNHQVCSVCFPKLRKSGTTMEDDIPCTWVKCPICCEVDGVEIGTSPKGAMVVERISGIHCAGHTDVATLEIVYTIWHEGEYDRRTAYLPDTLKGRILWKLLQEAWDRKLVFSIGDSVSRGLFNVPIWNIEHKTKLTGGEQNYGYPDETYLDRTIKKLQIYGIK